MFLIFVVFNNKRIKISKIKLLLLKMYKIENKTKNKKG